MKRHDQRILLVLGHSFGHLLDNRIELQRCSLEHADLFVKVNEIRLVQFVFSVFLDVVVSFHVEELAQLWIELSFLKDVLSDLLSFLCLSDFLI